MIRVFSHRRLVNALIIFILISFYGCKKTPIPEDSYSRFLPEGADLITEDEFTLGMWTRGFYDREITYEFIIISSCKNEQGSTIL